MWEGGVGPNAGIGRFLTIHRFGHQSARHQSSGCASTAKFDVFSARVFLDRFQNKRIHDITIVLRQNWVWGRGCGSGGDWGRGLGGLGPCVPGGMQ